jgi:uncharacterized membrane protein YtjA (UPF0391 family)
MLRCAGIFLCMALIAALAGFGGVAAVLTQVAWVALLFGVAAAIVLVMFDRRSPLS